jgi:hypothetical protein
MIAKDKAYKLVDKYYQKFPIESEVITIEGDLSWEYSDWKQAKQCALVCVDEIIEFGNRLDIREPMMFWNSVKSEINKL